MKIPKYMQDKMHKVAKLHNQANVIMAEVNEWFEKQGYGYDDLFIRNGNGISLEELEYGNDITDDFVKAAEDDFSGAEWQ